MTTPKYHDQVKKKIKPIAFLFEKYLHRTGRLKKLQERLDLFFGRAGDKLDK